MGVRKGKCLIPVKKTQPMNWRAIIAPSAYADVPVHFIAGTYERGSTELSGTIASST